MHILTYPKDAKALREVAAPVTKEMLASDGFKANLEEMKKLQSPHDLGLAATQVGWPVQLFLIYCDPTLEKQECNVFINPKITAESSNKVKADEGCLSFPDLGLKVMRPETITWEWENLAGEKFTAEQTFGPYTIDPVKGKIIERRAYYIRVIQHEIDHLNGKLMIDHISSTERLRFDRWLKKQN